MLGFDITPTGLLLAVPCLFAVGWYFLFVRGENDKFAGFPFINARRRWEVGTVLAQHRFQQNGLKILREGFAKSPVFAAVTDLGTKLLLSGKFIESFKEEKILDHSTALIELKDFMADVPGFETLFLGDLHNTGLRQIISIITKELDQFTTPFSEEVAEALERSWSDSKEWHEVMLLPSMLDLIARVSAIAFVGEPLCQDPEWLATVIGFTLIRHTAIHDLHKCPKTLRPLLHWFFPSCRKLRSEIKKARRLIEPALSKLRKERDLDSHQQKQKFTSLAWVDDFSLGKTYDAAMVQLRLANASIHSSADLLTKVLISLSDQPKLIEDMQAEVLAVVKEHGWRSSALNNMRLLDSVLKESQRLHPITLGTFSRITKQGVNLSNGTKIPSGTPIMITNDIVTDPAVYPDPERFDGYRFLRMRDGPEKAQAPFTTTGQNHLGFGYGKYACPGRFFASNEIKIALCHMLLKYEWKLVDDSPHEMLSEGLAAFLDPRARLKIRRRESSLDLKSLIGEVF